MDDGRTKYEHKTVQAVRGTEQRSVNKWQGEGWELVEEDRGRLRTTLTFRRAKKPVPWRLVAVLAAVVAVVVASSAAMAALTGGEDEPAASPTASDTPSISPSAEPSETPAASPDPTSSAATTPSEQAAPVVLTVKNSDDVAGLLATRDYCDPAIGRFADDHAGDTIEFDGSVSALFSTRGRSDLTVSPGDKGPRSTTGPVFKFERVTSTDLGLEGADALELGDLVRVTAAVDRYEGQQCLLYLNPETTTLR
jgi:hypothetical protein